MTIHRVLVVDDDEDTVEYLTALLEDGGFQVVPAGDTEAAIAQLGRHRVEAVVMDVLMPGRSGLDLLVRLRKDPRWRELRLVMLTGSDKVLGDGGRSYVAHHDGIRGADAVLGKPVDPARLLEVLGG